MLVPAPMGALPQAQTAALPTPVQPAQMAALPTPVPTTKIQIQWQLNCMTLRGGSKKASVVGKGRRSGGGGAGGGAGAVKGKNQFYSPRKPDAFEFSWNWQFLGQISPWDKIAALERCNQTGFSTDKLTGWSHNEEIWVTRRWRGRAARCGETLIGGQWRGRPARRGETTTGRRWPGRAGR